MIVYRPDIYTEPDGDPDTLANLGPLRPMAGIWEGTKGSDQSTPSSTGPNTTRLSSTTRCTQSTARQTAPSSSTA